MEKYINFITQKRNQAVNDFEKDFNKLLHSAFYGKTREKVRTRIKVEFFRKKKMILMKFQNSNQNLHSMVFINHMKIMIVIHLNKTKF